MLSKLTYSHKHEQQMLLGGFRFNQNNNILIVVIILIKIYNRHSTFFLTDPTNNWNNIQTNNFVRHGREKKKSCGKRMTTDDDKQLLPSKLMSRGSSMMVNNDMDQNETHRLVATNRCYYWLSKHIKITLCPDPLRIQSIDTTCSDLWTLTKVMECKLLVFERRVLWPRKTMINGEYVLNIEI